MREFCRPLAIFGLSLALACSSSSPSSEADGGGTDAGTTYTHDTYVTSAATQPASNSDAQAMGFDLNGDGTVDNVLGKALASVRGLTEVDDQANLSTALSHGDFILLLDLQTASSTSSAKLVMAAGDPATATPSPCADPSDTTCGQHLHGTGVFTLDSSTPPTSPLDGTLDNGVFTGGPATLLVPVAFLGSTPVLLPLHNAQVRIDGVSSLGLDHILVGGAVLQSDLDSQVLPSAAASLSALVQAHCAPDGSGTCACDGSVDAVTLVQIFDTAPKDCTITLSELSSSTLIQSVLTSDLTVNGQPALSFGERLSAVPGTFPTGN